MNKELAKSIGRAAREARKALQLTQEDAADRIQVSVEFYARIERGTSMPSIGTFARMASALGVSADAMIGHHSLVTSAPGVLARWAPTPPNDSPELRRVLRRLRKARPETVRLVNLLVKEFEAVAAASASKADAGPEGEGDEAASDQGEIRSLSSESIERTEARSGALPSSPRRPYAHENAAVV